MSRKEEIELVKENEPIILNGKEFLLKLADIELPSGTINILKWTEITQNNCDTVYKLDSQDYPIMIAHKLDDNYITYHSLHDCTPSIGTMAKYGNYYYIVLPKLY